MTAVQRFISLCTIGTMALAMAPIASAQGLGLGLGLKANANAGIGPRNGFTGLNTEARAEVRAELDACRDNNDDEDGRKACAEAVFAAHGIVKPAHTPVKRMRKIGIALKDRVEESCGEREDTDTWRECAAKVRAEARAEIREEHPNALGRIRAFWAKIRAKLSACAELDTVVEMRACILGVVNVNVAAE